MNGSHIRWIQVYERARFLCCTSPCLTPEEATEQARRFLEGEILGRLLGAPQPIEIERRHAPRRFGPSPRQ